METTNGGSPPIEDGTPADFWLYPNFPNPFNAVTMIYFDLPFSSDVQIEVFDILGKRVVVLRKRRIEARSNAVWLSGKDEVGNLVSSGIYICRMEARAKDGSKFLETIKMALVR